MTAFLRKRWFLIGLFILIPLGMVIGASVPPERLQILSSKTAGVLGRIVVAVVLFLMSVTLDNKKLRDALRSPGPVIWATLVNFVCIPLMAIPLMRFQQTEDFAVGLMISASVPCTMAAASVWTRKASGNDAVSLLVTIITNGACFLITPVWLRWGIGGAVELDIVDMMERLIVTALIPICLGQLFRANQAVKNFADQAKTQLGVIAQACILLLIFWASLKGGPHLAGNHSATPSAAAVGTVWASCIGLHLLAMMIVLQGSVLFRFAREDAAATAFAGSQKTLPIGIAIATDLLADRGLPFAVFPILMFHASQLFLDTLVIDRLKAWVESSPAADHDARGNDTTSGSDS